jgi:hypothetical protein
MAYIGNTNTTQGFIPAVDYFNGDGATVAFTLSRPVASVAQVQAVIENVPQAPGSAYTVSGQTITFDSAPPNGTGNIYVYYTSPITQVIQPGQGTVGTTQLVNGSVTNTKLDVASSDGTGAAIMPVGTTAQRPAGANGYYRFNTNLNAVEYYDGSNWKSVANTGNITSYSSTYLIIAGGGGGAHNTAPPQFAGGGAGGVLQGSTTLSIGTTYSFTVGAGGAATVSGSNSTGLSLTAIGGGRGGGGGMAAGASGGSGGGQGGSGATGTPNNAAGTAGQGNQGGSGTAPQDAAGGGGGFSSAGQNASGTTSGNGGAGLTSSITGTSVTYAGGGGRTDQGFRGGYSGSPSAVANSGSGGAGTAGNGGSGIVVLSIPSVFYSGTTTGSPTVTTSGANTILTFTSSGSYTA